MSRRLPSRPSCWSCSTRAQTGRAALVELAKLRAAGVACDTEYAGRSLKGQFTQLSRSGARGYVLVKADGAVLKRTRESPEEAIGVQEIAARYLG